MMLLLAPPRIILPPRFPRKFGLPWKLFRGIKFGGAIPRRLGGASDIWFIMPSSQCDWSLLGWLWIHDVRCWFMSLSCISGGGGLFMLIWCGKGNMFGIEKSRWSKNNVMSLNLSDKLRSWSHHQMIQHFDYRFPCRHPTFPCPPFRCRQEHSYEKNRCSCSCYDCNVEDVMESAGAAAAGSDYSGDTLTSKGRLIQTLPVDGIQVAISVCLFILRFLPETY